MNTPQTQAFAIRPYAKKELARCYFPQAKHPHTAVNHLMSWINRCEPISDKMHDQGY